MASNWITLTQDDLRAFMANVVLVSVEDTSPLGIDRLDYVVQLAVDRIRSAVLTGNRVPVSLMANSIPPDARQHALVIALQIGLAAVPNLGDFAFDKELPKMIERAETWITAAGKGEPNIVYPTDPDPATMPLGVSWGNMFNAIDRTSDTELPDMTTDDTTNPQGN